jgi:hypothetical protein
MVRAGPMGGNGAVIRHIGIRHQAIER